MADIRISQLTAKGAKISDTDEFAIAEDDGAGGYVSKKITGAEIKSTPIIDSAASTYNFGLADSNALVLLADATSVIARIPTNAVAAIPIGTRIEVIRNDTGTVQIVPISGVTLKSEGAKDKLAATYSQATLIKTATNTWYLFGDITT